VTWTPDWSGDEVNLAQFRSLFGYDSHSSISATTVTDVNKIRFEYNGTKANKVVALDAGYVDVKGTKYSGNITLLPYTAVVLMVDPNPVVPPASPTFASSAIENATPNILTMNYNLSLASIAPSPSAFAVTVNSLSRNITKVVVSGTTVQLTLSSPVVNGDKVTVSYTKPSTNQIQTPAGGQATTIGSQTVNNKVSSTSVIPQYVNSSIADETPTIIQIDYSMSMASVVPDITSFSVHVNSISQKVVSISISGTSVFLTIASEVSYTDVVTVAYLQPATNALISESGIKVASMSDQSVINKVNPGEGPIYLSSSIESSSPNVLEINYDEILDNSIPDKSAFIVMVNGVDRTITAVSITENTVLLTMQTPVIYGDSVTISYIKPSSNQLKKTSGEAALSFSYPQPVLNNCIKPVQNTAYKNSSITIYPNPASNYINISTPEPSLEQQILRIFDLGGKLCLENILNPGNSFHVQINLKSGIYIIQVASGSIINIVQKLIIN
jgi:uncharacterized repeat protein (TIGR02059 family)